MMNIIKILTYEELYLINIFKIYKLKKKKNSCLTWEKHQIIVCICIAEYQVLFYNWNLFLVNFIVDKDFFF